MRQQGRGLFTTVRTEGGILPPDLLARVAVRDGSLPGLDPESYHLKGGTRLPEAITSSWNRLVAAWRSFQEALDRLPEKEPATALTRERWLLPLFAELGYGRLAPVGGGLVAGGKSYPISHAWGAFPIHLLGWRTDIDRRTRGVAGAAAQSPHSLLQEFLNRSPERLYGFLSNGRVLRLLRDNTSLTRQAYVEFDLEAMFSGEVFADFALLWLVCHHSRLEGEPPETCILERWREAAREHGVRALEALRSGVERAIQVLGAGFLAHPANAALRDALRSGALSTQDYYRDLLRLVYRLIFLFVAEDRDVLLGPTAAPEARDRYLRYYSTARLRRLAARHRGTRHADLWVALKVVMRALGPAGGAPGLALPALGSFLWSAEAIPHLEASELANEHLLEAVRALSTVQDQGVRRSVDYRNLGTEELGSVYESLLELHPELNVDAATFELKVEAGHERKTTGSYYTPPQLVQSLLGTALDPVLEERARSPDPEAAILSLKVLDPASGSGHFLVAAAHRIARRLAAVRTGDTEPAPEALRQALRDVVSRCMYAVDVNEMAVELCKVSLWLEALDPGRPLSFLDAHVKRGNSLLGVTPALLARCIPDAAYKARALDDREACRALARRNREERKRLEKGAVQLTFEEAAASLARELRKAAERLAAAPDDTPEDLARKEELWHTQLASDAYRRAKLAADAWCAAFFLPKRKGADGITTDTIRRLAENPESVPEELRVAVERASRELGFFHWHLEFPEVFRVADGEPENPEAGWSGGFDVVLGNPPFMGGLRISGHFGEAYRRWLEKAFTPFKGTADLCAAFYRLAFNLLRPGGRLGMVATNTIGQGDTRESGLAPIVRSGGTITFARRFIRWPGAANVEVNLVAIVKPRNHDRPRQEAARVAEAGLPYEIGQSHVLDGHLAPFISSRLDPEPEAEPRHLPQNGGKAFQGDIVRGIGFVLRPEETEALLGRDPRNRDCLFPYLNGEDLNSHPEQKPSRWVICFHDWPLERARQYPDLLRIVEERVKPERERLRGPGDNRNRAFWWQFGAYRTGMRQAIAPLRQVLVRAEVSQLHMISFVPKDWIYSHMLIVFAFDDNYHFALLQSSVHEVWVWRQASSLESRNRYTPTDCFDTFPFPPEEYRRIANGEWRMEALPEPFHRAAQIGAEYHEHRRQIMRARNLGLTKTYNLFHDPNRTDADIQRLRELHVGMDKAILACYGWDDLSLDHGFYQNDRGQVRFTVSPQARREVLMRLYALNQTCATL